MRPVHPPSPSRSCRQIPQIRSITFTCFLSIKSCASWAMVFFTSSPNSIRYPRLPERYCDTADGAISSIRAAPTWETPHLTSSTAIAARIAGRKLYRDCCPDCRQNVPDYFLTGSLHTITSFKLSQLSHNILHSQLLFPSGTCNNLCDRPDQHRNFVFSGTYSTVYGINRVEKNNPQINPNIQVRGNAWEPSAQSTWITLQPRL